MSLALVDLEGGQELLLDAHRSIHAASTMKVPVLLELFRQAAEGRYRLEDAVLVRSEFASIADGSPYALSTGWWGGSCRGRSWRGA